MRACTAVRIFLAGAVLLTAWACSPAPQRITPTSTAEPSKLATDVPTSKSTSLPTTRMPSPSSLAQPQLVGEISLLAVPGIGRNPQALAVLDGRLYVANRGTDNVSVIEDDKVVAVIQVGKTPVAMAADAQTGRVYVAHEMDNTISILSGSQVVKTVPAPKSPACLAALEGRLYVGARSENALTVLDGQSGEKIATVPLRASIGVLSLAVNPSMHLLYAGVYDGVEIVDLQKLQVVGRLEHEVYVTLVADPNAGRFFISEYESDSNAQYLVAYDALGKSRLGRARIGGDPRGVVVSADGSRIYVANSWTNDLSVIDGKSMQTVATVPVGLQPMDVAIGRAGQVYVANSGSDNVAVVDGQSGRLQRVVALSGLPQGLAVDQSTGQLYVASASTNSVLVLQNQQIVAQEPAGLHPTEVALSPDGDILYVLNYVEGDLMLVSTQDKRVVRSAQMGELPRGLAVVPDQGQLYVSDVVLDRTDQHVLRQIELTTFNRSTVKPIRTLVDAQAGRVYLIASNGIPGSNGGLVVYITDLQGKQVDGQVGGLSMTGMALDSAGHLLFSTAARFSSYSLMVDDARSLQRVATLSLPRYPAAIGYNPRTHHIFVVLTFIPDIELNAAPEVWVLDSRGLGLVTRIALPAGMGYDDVYEWTVDEERGYVYLSDTHRGTVHVLRDVALPAPPTPVPTDTPTSWPTLTPQPAARVNATVRPEPTCAASVAERFRPTWSADRALRLVLRCPTQGPQDGWVAEQVFERGLMLWREADRAVLVLYNDGSWLRFVDRWQEGMSIYACEVTPPANSLRPQRGFGLIWCEEPGVKEGLGWAVGGEKGYTDAWQVFDNGEIIALSGQRAIYALFSDGTYRMYPIQ